MEEIKIGAEQKLFLAPETEEIDNADRIAKFSLDVKKYPFIIGYDANEKDNIITELKKLGCDEIKQLDFANYSNGGTSLDCYACGLQSTVDIKGTPVNVIGTSSATAFVAGTILKNWCANSEKTSIDIIADIKTEMSLSASMDTAEMLTLTEEDDTIIDNKNNTISAITEHHASSLNEGVSVLCVGNNCDDRCSSNDMSSAISIPFPYWQSGKISCPGNEVWCKFTANASDAHPNGSFGWHTVHTQGSLDTIGYLYDSYVNSGYIGFVIAQCWTLKRMAVWPIPVYEYVEQQTYAHHDNDNYMYGYRYARGHFEYR